MPRPMTRTERRPKLSRTTFLGKIRNPNPELTSYETAVRGLYLTGAATFPGAGVWGAGGKNCATVVLAHHAAG